jgi:PAS domain S-box-containing protein
MDDLCQTLAHTADGAFVIDETQRILCWNEAAQELLGYSAAEVVGQACYEIIRSCDDRGQPLCRRYCSVVATALAGKAVLTYDVAAQTKSGALRWINISILTWPTPTRIIHLFRDATQKKQNEQFIRQLFASTTDSAEAVSALPAAAPPPGPLTEREQEVLALLAQGYSTQEIAQALSISSATARNHVQSILNKLQVHSRLQAVAYAFEHGLIPRD